MNTLLSNNDESCKIATQDPTLRIAQGIPGISRDDCINKGFCYDDSIPNVPFCFQTEDRTNSYVLSLETLTKKYDAILIQYRQAYADYIQYLEQNVNNYNNTNKFLTAVQGQTFWGMNGISSSQVNSLEQCKAICSADGNCSGATFNPDKQMCWTRSGDGSLVAGLPNDYAIVKEDAKHLTTLNMFNQQLMDINQQILKMVNDGEPLYKEQRENRIKQSSVLTDNLNSLLEERSKILEVLQHYDDYDEEVLDEEIDINYHYWLMIIFSFIIILSVVFLVRISFYDTSNSSNSFF